MHKIFGFLLSVTVLVTAGCATSGLVLSGEALDALGQQYVETGKLMDSLLEHQLVKPEEYRVWAGFAKRFKAEYPHAVSLWKVAKASKDQPTQRQVQAILAELKADLLSFAFSAANRVHTGKK